MKKGILHGHFERSFISFFSLNTVISNFIRITIDPFLFNYIAASSGVSPREWELLKNYHDSLCTQFLSTRLFVTADQKWASWISSHRRYYLSSWWGRWFLSRKQYHPAKYTQLRLVLTTYLIFAFSATTRPVIWLYPS